MTSIQSSQQYYSGRLSSNSSTSMVVNDEGEEMIEFSALPKSKPLTGNQRFM